MHATIEEEDNPDDGENLFIQQKSNGMVNKNYLLLDNQSTVNQIANPNMLKNIRSPASQSRSTVMLECPRPTSKVN
jgi:hypothetical protein